MKVFSRRGRTRPSGALFCVGGTAAEGEKEAEMQRGHVTLEQSVRSTELFLGAAHPCPFGKG